jgi:hypothetical protein
MKSKGAWQVSESLVRVVAMALLFGGVVANPTRAADSAATVSAEFSDSTQLALQFAQPMQTWPNELPRDVVALSPDLPKKCTWASDTELNCAFDDAHAPAPATRYQIALTGDLRTQTGEPLAPTALYAETSRPAVRGWIIGWKHGRPRIVVTSEDDITRKDLAAVLRLRMDGTAIALPPLVKLRSRNPRDSHRYALKLAALEGASGVLTLAVVPGLKSDAGPLLGTQDETLLSAEFNLPFHLRGVACTRRDGVVGEVPTQGTIALDCMPGEDIRLVFSRRPDRASREALEHSLPTGVQLLEWGAGSASGRPSREGAITRAPTYLANLRINHTNATTVILLPDTLTSQRGEHLPAVDISIRTGDFRPLLQAQFQDALIDDGARPTAYATAMNVSEARIAVQSVGATERHEVLSISSTKQPNTAVAVTSRATAKALAEGGWARWMPQAPAGRDGRYRRRYEPVQFAAPAFDLFAISGRREILAWANAWDEDRPIAGAAVELLWLERADANPRIVARATTGADGVAMLHLPPDLSTGSRDDDNSYSDPDNYPMWLLRAASGTGRAPDRAVLPLGDSHSSRLGRQSETRTWGVADRPLYRAGDTVRYRLWQREKSGNRLLRLRKPVPVALKLYGEGDQKIIREWQATPTPDGALIGEVPLPIHLADDTYCIGTGENHSYDGACFFVGSFRAQDLWAEATTAGRVLRDGDLFAVDLAAGYYSGGPASGVDVSSITTMLTGLPLSQAYPQFGDYTFIDVMTHDARSGIALDGESALRFTTDAQGKAHLELPVQPHSDGSRVGMPAFGRLQLTAEVKLSDRERTVSNAATARYTRFEHFVGLRLDPEWPDATTPITVEAVVIDADGGAVADARIDVDVHYLPGFDDELQATDTAPLVTCHVVANTPTLCDFPRARSGRYRLSARSGDAAPTQLTRYIWRRDADSGNTVEGTELTLLEAPTRVGEPARVLLTQPSPRARALFVFGSGNTILGYRVEAMAGNARDVSLPVNPAWRGTVELSAYVRPVAASSVTKDGHRLPVRITEDSVHITLPDALPSRAPLALSFDNAHARPGDTVHLTVRNDSATAREVVLAVMDDAVRALAADWLPFFDPHGKHWLGDRAEYTYLSTSSFGTWNTFEWRLVLPWPHADAAPRPLPVRGGDDDIAQFVRDESVGYSPKTALPYVVDDGDAELHRVLVTGSRIALVDSFAVGAIPMSKLRPREAPGERELDGRSQASVRIRSHFADTALWQPDIRLAPGESRQIAFTVPDNLTRWRAVAWSSDADDDFDMIEATLEVGLPVEVRLQTPVRIYPGDRSRLAANVRQTGDAAVQVQTELHAQGIGKPSQQAGTIDLAARGQDSFALELAPQSAGTLQVVASAQTPQDNDAVAATVEVATPMIAARKVQAGWLQSQALVLDIPALPAGASAAELQVSLLRGGAGLIERWTRDLREYPHRCWEQILSRGVAAALAIERGDTKDWPDAANVVNEAIENAPLFQDGNGEFRYFAEVPQFELAGQAHPVALTAWSASGLALLRELGHRVAPDVEKRTLKFLSAHSDAGQAKPDAIDDTAFAAATGTALSREAGDHLWQAWDRLSLPGRIAATRALAKSAHPAAAEALGKVLGEAPKRGQVRVLTLGQRYDRWMSSAMREQCALIGLLHDYPQLDVPQHAQAELLAGLTDLYAGGIEAVDTQTGAYCLIGLRDPQAANTRAAPSATIRLGDQQSELRLPVGTDRADWRTSVGATTQLRIEPSAAEAAPASYTAELHYQEDARQARASAVGFSIERRYELLRDGRLAPMTGHSLREGEWLRITLSVQTAAPRHFVAVTDAVPGGLRPTDLRLSGVAGLALANVSDEGSYWFGTRRLDPRTPRFYAEYLPAGRHEVHYFALAGNAGDYLAAPASAELMYGSASNARTAATRLQIMNATPIEKPDGD